MDKQELESLIDREERALKSLVSFREEFIPSEEDVKPAKFHEEWSKILLEGTNHFAIEAFRESAKTQIVIRANLLHALTYAQKHREADRENWAKVGKTDIWYREKMCECISPDSQKFKREYFRYYEKQPGLKDMNIYTTVDLAISQKVNADYSAIVTVGVNSAGHWFVLDVEYGRYDPSTTMDAIFSAVQKWQPLTVGIESVAYQAALMHFLEREMPKRGIFFRITPLKAETKKELRIDSLQPRFSVGTVWFRREAVWLDKIEAELLAYPHGAHDDIIDALAYMEQVASEPFKYGRGGGELEEWNPIAGSM